MKAYRSICYGHHHPLIKTEVVNQALREAVSTTKIYASLEATRHVHGPGSFGGTKKSRSESSRNHVGWQ